MAHRIFNLAALCSATAFCALLAACLCAGTINPAKEFLSLGPACHISIGVRGSGPCVEMFNDANYGPYRGSIIEIRPHGQPSQIGSAGFDFPGVYYRHFRWPSGNSLWTLSLSLVYFVVMSAVLPIIWVVRRSRRAQPRPQSGV